MYEDIGDGYRSHEPRAPKWQGLTSQTQLRRLYPEWVKPAMEAARVARRAILKAISAIEERKRVVRDASSVASQLRWEKRDAFETAQRDRAVSDEDVAVLSNAAWWAQVDYDRAERAHSALFTAAYRMQDRLEAFDKADKHEHVVVPAHWHEYGCQTCKDANLALAALEERGPKA